MFLYGRRINGQALDNPFGELPLPLEKSELDILLLELREGILSAHQTLIMSHIRLGLCIACQYVRRMPSKVLDIISEAILGIVVAFHKMQDRDFKVENPVAFVITQIHSAIGAFLKRDSVIKFSYKKMKKVVELTEDVIDPKTIHPQIGLEDIINMDCVDDREKQILELKAKKLTNIEIGKKLNLTSARIGQLLASLEMRFKGK